MAGLVVAINKKDEEKYGYLLGRRAHWRKYHDDARINLPDKKLAFIDIVDIKGTSYASA
jgi:hypothetical protein